MLWITGAAGFIGGCFSRRAAMRGEALCLVDKLSYASNLQSILPIFNERVVFHPLDIGDSDSISELLRTTECSGIVNFAAESHVDRSISTPVAFAENNVLSTVRFFDEARKYWSELDGERKAKFRFIQISTDEVFGSLGVEGQFDESSPYRPNSPYSASKASADHFARSYFQTYKFPTLIIHSSNNFGPWQHPEKFIPTVICNALAGRPIPIYGTGKQVRDWIYVEENCSAIEHLFKEGKSGENYCIGGNNEWTNLELANAILKIVASETGNSPESLLRLLQHIDDRPGHDFRYSIDDSKLRSTWSPQTSFEETLRSTVRWYIDRP